MEAIQEAIQESGLNSSPELQGLCEACYLLGRKSITHAQYLGRLNSPNFKGRPKGARDKKKHSRPKTNIYKYKLLNNRIFKVLSDEHKQLFRDKVNSLELIDPKTHKQLKAELDSLLEKDCFKQMENVYEI